MKFSVLLPTRNRLNLLGYAVETVRRQRYPDWEIIVSDNFSNEDIEGYVRSINDARIKYFRTEKFLPVTDNWNNALVRSTGDYIIMLGDDDGLMPDYFSILGKLITDYGSPELIYTSAFLFAYPGVMPNQESGFLTSYNESGVFKGRREPFFLERPAARRLADHSLNFRIRFDYNMQFSLVSRNLIAKMANYGAFYQSPYPDYYASNAMMLKADRILIVPRPLVTIGISPKSFGFFYFNDSEDAGNAFLKNVPDPGMAQQLEKIILPGTEMNTSWLLALETLARNFCKEGNFRVNYHRYRLLQICTVYAKLISGKTGAKPALKDLRTRLSLFERILYDLPLSVIARLALIAPQRRQRLIADYIMAATGSHPRHGAPMIEGKYNTILDVFDSIARNSDSAEGKALV